MTHAIPSRLATRLPLALFPLLLLLLAPPASAAAGADEDDCTSFWRCPGRAVGRALRDVAGTIGSALREIGGGIGAGARVILCGVSCGDPSTPAEAKPIITSPDFIPPPPQSETTSSHEAGADPDESTCEAFLPRMLEGACPLLVDPIGFIIGTIGFAVSVPFILVRDAVRTFFGMIESAVASVWDMLGRAITSVGNILERAVLIFFGFIIQAAHLANAGLRGFSEHFGPLGPIVLMLSYGALLALLIGLGTLLTRAARFAMTRDLRDLLR